MFELLILIALVAFGVLGILVALSPSSGLAGPLSSHHQVSRLDDRLRTIQAQLAERSEAAGGGDEKPPEQ